MEVCREVGERAEALAAGVRMERVGVALARAWRNTAATSARNLVVTWDTSTV